MRTSFIHITLSLFVLSGLGALRSCGKVAKSADKMHDVSKFRKLRHIKPIIANERNAKAISHLDNLNTILSLAETSAALKEEFPDSVISTNHSVLYNFYAPIEVNEVKYLDDLECHIPTDYKTRYYFNEKKVLLYTKSPEFIRICRVYGVNRNIPNKWYNNGHGISYMLRSNENITNEYNDESEYTLSFYLKSDKHLFQIYFQEKNVLEKDESKKLEHLVRIIHQIYQDTRVDVEEDENQN